MSKITPIISANAQTILCKKYLRPKTSQLHSPDDACPHCSKVHETVEELLTRCSFGDENYYNLLASFDFLPNSPTLFNAGTNQGTMSGCFKFDVQDTMDSILDVARKAALVLKWGGGTGFYLGNIRAKDALIHTTHGKACGPVAVLEYYHAGALLITQSGKRQAAQMGVLDCSHPDIRSFIHCKDGGKNLSTFNISVACTDKFMEEAQKTGTPEYQLFEEMIDSAWKTGDPGIYFVDTAERTNPTPWLGKLTGTNPCGEVPLLDNEPCNLGSINLGHMIKNGSIDTVRLDKTVRLAVRYLNTVLDHNEFPVPEIKKAALLTRKIGLGVMGWADMLALLHIHYDSENALKLAGQIMVAITATGHAESEKLGICPAYFTGGDERNGRIGGTPNRYNATVTCIAPAGTICNIANCSSGIEPHYSLDADRVMGDGITHLTENVRVDTGSFVPHVAHDIGSAWHIKHQAAFQEHTDLAISKTVNLRNDATRDNIRSVYLLAWKLGCKGVTIYRDGSRAVQVLNEKQVPVLESALEGKGNAGRFEEYPTDTKFGITRRKMPKDGLAYRHSFRVGDTEGYLHIGLSNVGDPLNKRLEGDPLELFITGSNQGSTVSGLLASLSIVSSMAFQYGVPLETLVSKLQHINFEPKGMTDDSDIPMVSSIVSYIFRYVGKRCLSVGSVVAETQTGMTCPECGAAVIAQEGCYACSKACGWTRC